MMDFIFSTNMLNLILFKKRYSTYLNEYFLLFNILVEKIKSIIQKMFLLENKLG